MISDGEDEGAPSVRDPRERAQRDGSPEKRPQTGTAAERGEPLADREQDREELRIAPRPPGRLPTR